MAKYYTTDCKACGKPISRGVRGKQCMSALLTPAYQAWAGKHPLQRVTSDSRKAGMCAECYEKEEVS